MSENAKTAAKNLYSSLPPYIKYPVKMEPLIEHISGIDIVYSDLATEEGYSVHYDGRYRIFISSGSHPMRLRFTLAHELGHIVLGHIKGHRHSPSAGEEWEANVFASELLMPEMLVRQYRNYSLDWITQFFFVSRKAAEIRLAEINQT